MTIRSQIGTAEVTLEGTEVRTAMTADLLLRYDTEALLTAVGEVLRGIGDGHLTDTARQVLDLIEGEPAADEQEPATDEEDTRWMPPVAGATGDPLL